MKDCLVMVYRISDLPVPPIAATAKVCIKCGEPVWLSESTVRDCARAGQHAKPCCLECMPKNTMLKAAIGPETLRAALRAVTQHELRAIAERN